MTALANTDYKTVKGIKSELFEQLKAQARIQKKALERIFLLIN